MKINRVFVQGKNLEESIAKALARANKNKVNKIISIIEKKAYFKHEGVYVIYLTKDEFYQTDTIILR